MPTQKVKIKVHRITVINSIFHDTFWSGVHHTTNPYTVSGNPCPQLPSAMKDTKRNKTKQNKEMMMCYCYVWSLCCCRTQFQLMYKKVLPPMN